MRSISLHIMYMCISKNLFNTTVISDSTTTK